MKKIVYIFLGLVLLTSCSDYLDVNEDPNNPQLSQVKPENLLAAALVIPFRTQAINMNEYGNVMSNSWAGNVNAFTGGYRNEFTMDFTTATRSVIWDNLYLGIGHLDNITKYPNPTGDYDNFIGVSKIMKSYYMEYIVDLYGDAPYSEAWERGKNLTPKYDDDKAIYLDLIKQLDVARNLLASPSAVPIDTQDVMFHGDLNAWISFANTVELKMWLRLSGLSNAQLGTDLAALKATRLPLLAAGNDFVIADVTINPGYSNAVLAQNNPFYSVWGPSATGSAAGTSRTFTVASDYIAKVLMGTRNNAHVNSLGVVDARRNRIFRATSGTTITGVVQGDVAAAAGGTAPNPLSLIGVGITGYTGLNAGDAHNNGSRKDGYVMTLSEADFLISEASQVFPDFSGYDGKTYFQAGISASFAYHSKDLLSVALADISPASYLTAINLKQGLGWDGTPNKIEAIMTQKWIALCGIHGIEPFLGIVRTGFPDVPLAITANATRTNKPKRLLYPTSEYTANSANVPNVTLDQIFAVNAYSPFWAQ
ncbi:SusD/RagB family nutrient-binding outer membrane lipoprotein [Flavobacterium sp.]|uniref:SusD/RagB family nutrient-binding outer membrane lipoprotein n=1 Tax=Flavobacterium sp. TaxID=239 RepID=UPI0038FC6E0B